MPPRRMSGIAASSSSRAAPAIGPASAVAAGERAGPRRARVVAEAQPQHHGPARARLALHAAGHPLGEVGRSPRRVRARARAARAPAARRTSAARGGAGRPRSWLLRDRVDVAARRLPEDRHELGLARARPPPDGADPVRVQLARRRRPDAPHPLDRQRVQELELARRAPRRTGRRAWPSGWRSSPAPSCRDADAQRQPDLVAHLAPQPRGHLAAGVAARPRDVEERLLHRRRAGRRRRGARRSRTPRGSPRM